MVAELKKKRELAEKKTGTTPNIDPYSTDQSRLIVRDPNVVGSASNTLGSPKNFTNDQHSSPSRTNPSGNDDKRDNQISPATLSKDNRTSNNNNQDKQDRDKYQTFDDGAKLLPTQCQPQYDTSYTDTIPMQEVQPRVVVRTVRGDGSQPAYPQSNLEQSTKFVPIPVQVERSGGSNQQYVQPPYHSDPYYKSVNS